MNRLLPLLALVLTGLLGFPSLLWAHDVRIALEPTPVLGEPVLVTPINPREPPVPGSRDLPAQDSTASTDPEPPAFEDELTPTSEVTGVADSCEPNDTPAQACPIPLDAVSGPFTVVPDSDQDFYRLDLPQEPSIETLISVTATSGLDLVLTVRQEERVIARGASPLTLTAAIWGVVSLRVENRDPWPASEERYRIEVRRTIVEPSSDAAAEDGPGDALENNWSFDTASPIALGVVYDLSLRCPETRPDACAGGDHDYLLAPVKAGVAYRIATFDLDPGLDTVIELFWNGRTAPVAGSDDAGPGGLLSALTWTAPADGLLIIRVAPRNGGLSQQFGAEASAAYRFAITPAASELARKLDATIQEQAQLPTPTPTVPPSSTRPAPATGQGVAGGSSSDGGDIAESITSGPAVIVAEAVLRREPRERSTALATLPVEAPVTIRGPVQGLWVSVESDASVLPGWVRWSDLRRLAQVTGTVESPLPTAAETTNPNDESQPFDAAESAVLSPTPTSVEGEPTPTTAQVTVRMIDLALPTPAPPPAPRLPLSLTILVLATDQLLRQAPVRGFTTPTPDRRQPLANVRVQLVNVFGDLLAEGLTDAIGSIRLGRDVSAGTALYVRVPAWGVQMPVSPDVETQIITVPEDHR